ncbi:hypothetical protein BHE74_00003783 [Ensete ventricosum]|nr:hypothetical protein BHE74_00003783 [Ensete ventricosum]
MGSEEAWEQVALAYPFFWKSPGVCRFVTSYDPPAFLPPKLWRPRTNSPVATSLVLLTVAARSTTRRIGRDRAPLRMSGQGCVSGILQTSVVNLSTNWASGSSLPYMRPSSEAAVGLGRELAMKLSSNSLARWLKDEMEDGFNRLYHI